MYNIYTYKEMLNLKKLLTSTVAISVLLSTFNQSFVSADETNPKNNEQQQLSDIMKGERLSASQQKEIDKDFVESGWQKKKQLMVQLFILWMMQR